MIRLISLAAFDVGIVRKVGVRGYLRIFRDLAVQFEGGSLAT